MQLVLHTPDTRLFIRSCQSDAITVADRILRESFILSSARLLENWPVKKIEQLDSATIAPILTLEPEVVLLGTGATTVFPQPAILAEFLTRRIGIEAMDNAAACRTFNVLSDEGRNVVAAFILG